MGGMKQGVVDGAYVGSQTEKWHKDQHFFPII